MYGVLLAVGLLFGGLVGAAVGAVHPDLERRLQTDATPKKNLFVDGYRVNIDEIPIVNHIPNNVSWSELKQLRKLTASAAYDIYTAEFLGNEVIVKTLRNQTRKKSRSGAPKEMEKEIKVLSRLNHPNILRIYGHGKDLCCVLVFF